MKSETGRNADSVPSVRRTVYPNFPSHLQLTGQLMPLKCEVTHCLVDW
jgi:hypothetical protein